MATDDNHPSGRSADRDRQSDTAKPPDFAKLAGRISAVTTKCLLSALVLVAGLGFGRQVLRWWDSDGQGPAAVSQPGQTAAALGDPARLHVIQFADQAWSLRRQAISGSKEAAATALRARCRQMLRRTRLPEDNPQQAEIDFLCRLATCRPVEQQEGKWQLYQLDEAFPIVVGTQATRGEGRGARVEGSNPYPLSPTPYRVVTWGLAVPGAPDAWTLYTFQPESPSDGRFDALSQIPLPPECRRILSVRVVGGGVIVAFEGPRQAKITTDFYDRWFARHDWKAARKWRQSGSGWYARYTAPEQQPAVSAEVRFNADLRGRCRGLLVILPSSSGGGNRTSIVKPWENKDS